jgi:alpha-methylacyl-CoA racemase
VTEIETQTPTAATGAPPPAPDDADDAGDADDVGTEGPGGPLRGIVVLDLASVGPAARCTRILADYGATVIKVGAVPGRGAEPIAPPFYAYSGSRYLHRTAIDLKEADGRQAFLALVRTADVVVESFRPGVVDRLGIGFEDLVKVNPSIILCSTTGYGQHGPRSSWAGHDINYLAVGGYLAATEPRGDGGPPVPGATIADAAGGGMQAAMAVMAAIVGRDAGGAGRTGGGPGGATHLDVSVADGVLWLTSLAVDEHLATGAPVGYGHNIITGRYACYGTYRAADGGWLAVGAIEPKFYANLCRLLGCRQWSDHQLDDEVQDKIRQDFSAAFAAKDRDTWVQELGGADTCVTPVLSVDELVDDDQFRARHAIVDAVTEPESTGVPVRFQQVGPVLAGMVAPPGPVEVGDPSRSDTDRLLGGAGMAPERIAELRERGVVA